MIYKRPFERPLKRPTHYRCASVTSRKTAGLTALRACLVNEVSCGSKLIDFRGQNEVAFREPINLVSPSRDFYPTPAKANVGMVALLLC